MRRPLLLVLPALVLAACDTGPPSGLEEPPVNVAIPLSDLAGGEYLGFEGGLYPDGANFIPSDHRTAGVSRGGQVVPRDPAGEPDPEGRIVLLSVGMSNTAQEFCGASAPGEACLNGSLAWWFQSDPDANVSSVRLVDGARPGEHAESWEDPAGPNYDRIRDQDLAPAGLSEAQVQVIWLKVANRDSPARPSLPDGSSDAHLLAGRLGNILRALHVRYPNLQQVFLSSRIFAGYADPQATSPEPYAYETGFAVKWAIEAQIRQVRGEGIDPLVGDLDFRSAAPWAAWSAYLWADGDNPRSDGLTWVGADFQPDGMHPSGSGRRKVGFLLHTYFRNSPKTACWYLAVGSCP